MREQRNQGPHLIRPTAVYLAPHVRDLLELTSSTLRREIRLKRLRVAKRAGKYYFLGAWLLEWIAAGELKPKAGPGGCACDGESASADGKGV